MRIAAGVLIIVVAAMDLLGSFGYLFVGAVSNAAKEGGNIVLKTALEKKDLTAKEIQQATAALDAISAFGSLAFPFGAVLLVLSGLAIAAGVVLFREKAATFALMVGVLQILMELLAIILWSSAAKTLVIGPFNILGLVAGVFVIIAAMSYKKQPEPRLA